MPLYISIRRSIEFFNGIVRFLCHNTAFWYTSATVQSAEIIQYAVTQNHGDSRKSRHMTKITVKVTVIVNT